ncbi:MAG: pseudoazurin [Gammaproteobacteria bacterium]|nr:pseudoazurin [Gammaproteobacteria bacterium]
MMKKYLLIGLMLVNVSMPAKAAEHTVNLVTTGSDGQTMVMEPGYINIAVGDVINFVPSDATHNAESLSIPTGAKKFTTPYGQPTKVTFDTEGAYIYKCVPHITMGMIGVIQVGNAVNLDATKAAMAQLKPMVFMNKERLDQYLSQIQ